MWGNATFSVGVVIERVVETHKSMPVVSVWESGVISVRIII